MSTLPPLPSLQPEEAAAPKVPVAIAQLDADALMSKAESYLGMHHAQTSRQFQGAYYHPWNRGMAITQAKAEILQEALRESRKKFADAPAKTKNVLIWNDFAPKVPDLLKEEVTIIAVPNKTGRRRALKPHESLRDANPAKADISPAAFAGSESAAKAIIAKKDDTNPEKAGAARKASKPRSR